MAKSKKERMLEFDITMDKKSFKLYLKDGKPIKIVCKNAARGYEIYPRDIVFSWKCEQLVNQLFSQEKSYSLKALYDALEEGDLKSFAKEKIDKLIVRYEKALSNLKS